MTTMDLEVSVGEDFYAKLYLRSGQNKSAYNLANAVVFGGVKALYNDPEQVFSFETEVIDSANGLVAIKAPRAAVFRLQQFAPRADAKTGKFFYDVCLREASGSVKRILGGTLVANFAAQ